MEKKWKWAACGYDLLGYQSTEEIIELCKYAGINAIEMNSIFINEKGEKEIEAMGEKYKRAGIEIYNFHLPYSPEEDITSFYETKRRKIVQQLSIIIERAFLLGSKIIILHPSTSYYSIEGEGFDRYFSQMIKSLEELLKFVEKFKMFIALENIPPIRDGHRFGSLPEHFIIFSEKFPEPHLGFCLDTGHANLSIKYEGPFLFFDAMKDKILTFHIQDNPGDRDLHLAPGYGIIDWKRFFKKMENIKFSNHVCIETPPFGPAERGKYHPDLWKKLFREMDEFLEKL